VASLRSALASLAQDEDVQSSRGAKLPDATSHAHRAMTAAADAARAASSADLPETLQKLTPEAAAAAKASATDYVEGLRRQHRSAKLLEALEGGPEKTEVVANLCDLRPGADIDDLVVAIQVRAFLKRSVVVL